MGNVVRIVDHSNRENVKTLRVLLERALFGEVVGVAICVKTKDGTENVVFTGAYKANRAEAAVAALKLSMKLASPEYESPP